MRGHHSSRGFSLIEVAIILSVLAMVLTAALGWLAPAGKEEAFKAEETKERLTDIRRAIHAFRVNHGRLPCPARRNMRDDDPRLGEEDCSQDASASNINYGILPVRALGISPEYLVDGWGRRFSYQVAVPLCGRNGGAETLPVNCSSIRYTTPAAVVVPSSEYLEVRTTDAANPGPNPAVAANRRTISTQVAYAVVSHGANGYGAWLSSGVQRLSGSTTLKEDINRVPDKLFWTDAYSGAFDDIVIFDTKETIEASTRDYDRWVMTLQECQQNVTNIIGSMTADEFRLMNTGLFAAGDNMFSPTRTSGPAIMNMLWHAQEVCIRYFPYYYDLSTRIKCPGVDVDTSAGNRLMYNPNVPVAPPAMTENNKGYCACSTGAGFNPLTGACD